MISSELSTPSRAIAGMGPLWECRLSSSTTTFALRAPACLFFLTTSPRAGVEALELPVWLNDEDECKNMRINPNAIKHFRLLFITSSSAGLERQHPPY